MEDMGDGLQDLEKFYGDRIDLLTEHLFPEGFLNFGYWKDIPTDSVGVQERVNSGKNLYYRVFDELQISTGDRILEVGCGRGRGAALAATELSPFEVHGIDSVNRQIEKARIENKSEINASSGRLTYTSATADALPYPAKYFDKAYSVEVAVHFPDLRVVVNELDRVLKENATLSVASIFSPSRSITLDNWLDLLTREEAPPSAIHAHSVSSLIEPLIEAGFGGIKITSIGGYVWPGFNRYLDFLEFPGQSKRRNWCFAFEAGILDYYIITAERGFDR